MTKVFGIELNSVQACAQVSALADGAVSAAVEFIARTLGDAPTLEAYNKLRLDWRAAYMEQRGLDALDKKTAGALDTAWSRNVLGQLKEQYEFEVPKATTAAATKKAEQRKLPEAVAQATKPADLDAIAMPSDKVEAAKLQATIATKRKQLVEAEARAEAKATKDAAKAKRDAFIAYFKALPDADAQDYYDLRDKRYGAIARHIPLPLLQAAIDVQTKALESLSKPSKGAKRAPKATA